MCEWFEFILKYMTLLSCVDEGCICVGLVRSLRDQEIWLLIDLHISHCRIIQIFFWCHVKQSIGPIHEMAMLIKSMFHQKLRVRPPLYSGLWLRHRAFFLWGSVTFPLLSLLGGLSIDVIHFLHSTRKQSSNKPLIIYIFGIYRSIPLRWRT